MVSIYGKLLVVSLLLMFFAVIGENVCDLLLVFALVNNYCMQISSTTSPNLKLMNPYGYCIRRKRNPYTF